jgi:hypothetical protein
MIGSQEEEDPFAPYRHQAYYVLIHHTVPMHTAMYRYRLALRSQNHQQSKTGEDIDLDIERIRHDIKQSMKERARHGIDCV